MSHKKFGPDGSAFLTFIGYKQTNKQTNRQTDRQAKFIYRYSNFALKIANKNKLKLEINKRLAIFFYQL